jgi:hypothetical protein
MGPSRSGETGEDVSLCEESDQVTAAVDDGERLDVVVGHHSRRGDEVEVGQQPRCPRRDEVTGLPRSPGLVCRDQ